MHLWTPPPPPRLWLSNCLHTTSCRAESREHHGPDGDCSLTADHYQFLVQLAERTSCYKLLMGRQNTHTIGEDVLVENSPEGSPTSPAFRFERPSVTATIVTESEEARLDFNSDSPECSNVSGLWSVGEGGAGLCCGGLSEVLEGCRGLWRAVKGSGGLWGIGGRAPPPPKAPKLLLFSFLVAFENFRRFDLFGNPFVVPRMGWGDHLLAIRVLEHPWGHT